MILRGGCDKTIVLPNGSVKVGMKEDYGGKISREGGMMKNERKTETMKNERGCAETMWKRDRREVVSGRTPDEGLLLNSRTNQSLAGGYRS
jgi:hypothetical protein